VATNGQQNCNDLKTENSPLSIGLSVLASTRWDASFRSCVVIGLHRLPRCREAFLKAGLLPVRDHYYEPQFRFDPGVDFNQPRNLPGIEWNDAGQLAFLDGMTHESELMNLQRTPVDPPGFYLDNLTFGPGDAEVWYQIVRALRPARIIEIGCGYSTVLAQMAIEKNHHDDPNCVCEHTCVEPYEVPWLDSFGPKVVRELVENLPLSLFETLEANDVLFIDSSHMIRPSGDVLFEILPILRPGVIVHIHDIFSPRNYPTEWIVE
jgi:hypothetical protein